MAPPHKENSVPGLTHRANPLIRTADKEKEQLINYQQDAAFIFWTVEGWLSLNRKAPNFCPH